MSRSTTQPTQAELEVLAALATEAASHGPGALALEGEVIASSVEDPATKPSKAAVAKAAQASAVMTDLRRYASSLFQDLGVVFVYETKTFYTYEHPCYVARDPLFFGALLEKADGYRWLSNEKNNKELLGVLKRAYGKSYQEFKKSTDGFINFQNGHYDKKTKTLTPHDQVTETRYFTYCLPFAYDPSACAPQWEAFMVQCFNERKTDGSGTVDLESVQCLHEFMGYTLSGDENWADRMLLAVGPSGANGKGTIWNIMRRLLGHGAYSALPVSMLGRETGRLGLDGKLANLSAEEPVDAFVKNESIMKSLSSRDAVTARSLFQNSYEMVSRAKLWMSCNETPTSHDMTGGWFRRLLVLHFNNKAVEPWELEEETKNYRRGFVYKKDIHLEEKLATELPGIFNLAMNAYEAAKAKGNLTIPRASHEAVKEMADDDMVTDILETVIAQGTSVHDKLSNEEILGLFNQGVAARGLGVKIPQRKILATVRLLFQTENYKSGGIRGIKGIQKRSTSSQGVQQSIDDFIPG